MPSAVRRARKFAVGLIDHDGWLMSGLEVLCGIRRLTEFGHVGLGGPFGWSLPATGVAFAMVHNRLLAP